MSVRPLVELMRDTSAARWIEERLWPWDRQGLRLGSLVPEGFPAYARIRHPVLEENPMGQRAEGSLTPEQCEQLAGLLRPCTSTPEQCWFCVWEGFGFIDRRAYRCVPRVKVENRAYLLYRGPLTAFTSFYWGPTWQSPNLWWPHDRAWCVVTEIDLPETYVGGSEPCIERILSDDGFDAIRTTPDARVGEGGGPDHPVD